MVVNFDRFSRFEKPNFYVCNPGCVYEDGVLSNTVGILDMTHDEQLVFNFGSTSQLDFRVYQHDKEGFPKQFASLKNRRLIFLDDIGFFVISEVEESTSVEGRYKDITAVSCEAELQGKNIPYIEDGTYKFYDGTPDGQGLLEKLIHSVPMWTIAHVDETVALRYRTFEDVDFSLNVLGFMLEQLQDAYECVFIFDIINRTVSVYDQANFVNDTDIHITNDDLITELNVSESSDDLYTALSVTGSEELGINAVNPLGTSTIYNFDYYLDWMSPELGEAVAAWQALVQEKSDEYYTLQKDYYDNLTDSSTLHAELGKLNTQYEMYKKCRDNCVAETSQDEIAQYNEVIVAVGGIAIPENEGYTWVKYADSALGQNITSDPYGKNYIGIAYDKNTSVESLNANDYEWSEFRDGRAIERVIEKVVDDETVTETTYTFVVFADSSTATIGFNPDNKACIGISIGNETSVRPTDNTAYSWSYINQGNLGIPQVLAHLTEMIEEARVQITNKEAEIAEMDETLEAQKAEAEAIHEAVAMQNYFTSAQLEELQNYIFEGTYTDEYIGVTESMTSAERFEQMKTLYDRSIAQLIKISTPTQEFSVDVENFVFQQKFAAWSAQLRTGCIINVELEEDDVAPLFLCTLEVNYEDRQLNLTFGNRLNRFDAKALFEDTLGQISKTSNTLSYIRDTIYPIKNGEFNQMKEALETSKTLTKNSVLSSKNEQVVIDDTGYTGRKLMPDGTLDPHQIKINGRNIVFTDDAWETCKTAIGEILLGDGASSYGINAEIILGDLIMGNQLRIINSDGQDIFAVQDEKITASLDGITDTLEGFKNDIEINSTGLSQVTTYANTLGTDLSEFRQYIKVGVLDGSEGGSDAEYGVKIGRSDNAFSAKFTSNELGFYESEDKTAFFSNNKLNVNNVRTTKIQMAATYDDLISEIGDGEINNWQIDAEGGFSLRWIGK